ncbi:MULTISPECIES: helix-turn-helix domain-containing protein [Pseudomonas]|uniref:Helix-turn-helix transcriptional regulator n=1 Tax=Pseudomonas wuhanensis TaxID=2954098 RepID=A0ABY9GMW7_9PSED|nr:MULTISPECIES: helix-turn-helix transcriptional regulator [unclassified Pseudomonas]WLI11281.1 helix-turn-helix transcriptional regulator [Pseudomonas sp. FP603]WLI17115.1 helix-turn-helix transcriptional regulator [Pseudomonas sp. FP607]
MKENINEWRRELIDDIVMQHVTGIETLGTAIRRLRLEVTGFDQETFAAMCKMSTKALYQIEKDKANPTVSTLEAILRKFGLRLGLTIATTLYTPPLGQQKPVSKAPVRGANPKRKSAGQLSRVATLRAATKTKDGDKSPTE